MRESYRSLELNNSQKELVLKGQGDAHWIAFHSLSYIFLNYNFVCFLVWYLIKKLSNNDQMKKNKNNWNYCT